MSDSFKSLFSHLPELYNQCFKAERCKHISSPSIIRMIRSRKMRWAGHVAEWGRRGTHIGYWWEIQKGRDQWEDQDVGGWTILKWIVET
jgi:hypothetical protein